MHVRFGEGSRETYYGSPWQGARDLLYFAKRALSRGESPVMVVAAIANHRRSNKNGAQRYAELTERKAQEASRIENNNCKEPSR